MARINQEILDELVEDCSAGNDEYVVSKWIIEKVPAIFNDPKIRKQSQWQSQLQ